MRSIEQFAPAASHLDETVESDHVQPSQQQLDDALASARTYWYALGERAESFHHQVLSGLNVHCILARVPAIPTEPVRVSKILRHTETLCTNTFSTWHVKASDGCGIDGREKIIESNIWVGIQEATKVELSGDCFRRWPPSDLGENETNYLAILTLGWCYVLSACMIELQGQKGAKMFYTNSVTTRFGNDGGMSSSRAAEVEFFKEERVAERWWTAILAPKQGWQAIISEEDGSFQAPWAVSLDASLPFVLRWKESNTLPSTLVDVEVPSACQAFEFLKMFSSFRNLDDQMSAAFMAALTIPTHNYFRSIVRLPFPISAANDQMDHSRAYTSTCVIHFGELPFFMSLSCNITVVTSCLCALFWNEDVPCNLVSPWLHPVLNELSKCIDVEASRLHYHELLSYMCAIRRPSIFPLWVGASISGLAPKVLSLVESGISELDPVAYPWTGCPQSFMEITLPKTICKSPNGDITRADAWRLRYLPPTLDDDLHYNQPPLAPWKPVGWTKWQNCELRVQAHRQCKRHRLVYVGWSWILIDGRTKSEKGHVSSPITNSVPASAIKPRSKIAFVSVPLSSSQTASQNASRNVFQWTTINGHGIPQESAYRDDWLENCLEEDQDSDLSESVLDGRISPSSTNYNTCRTPVINRSEDKQSIYEWVAKGFPHENSRSLTEIPT